MATLSYIINQTNVKGRYKKLENTFNSGWLPPDYACKMDVWFPWVENVNDFMNKVLIIELMGKIRFYVWESGSRLFVASSGKNGAVSPYTEKLEAEFIDVDPSMYYKPQLANGDYKAQEKWIYIRPKGNSFELIFKNPH